MNEIHGGGEECDAHSASLRQLRRVERCNVHSAGEWTLEVGDETQLCDFLCCCTDDAEGKFSQSSL